eukprot:12882986-Prorocentrum_lima.AAC.1
MLPNTASNTPRQASDTPDRPQPTNTQDQLLSGWTALYQQETRNQVTRRTFPWWPVLANDSAFHTATLEEH